jgi:phosphatidylglycerophosphate synthase
MVRYKGRIERSPQSKIGPRKEANGTMASAAPLLVIDARPCGPRGPLACEIVLGRSVLGRLVDQLATLAPGRLIAVHVRPSEHQLLVSLVGESLADRVRFVSAAPTPRVWMVRTDRLYETGRLRRALRQGRNPEAAEIWRLDRPEELERAEEELTRRLTYQPLGRYWAFPLAERLAAALAPTRVRPNAVTVMAAVLMLGAAGLVAFAGTGAWPQAGAALALALALILDTADGRLARLQGTCSEFGRWLDTVLDELVDLALHAAIAWSLFAASRHPAWLLLGMLYISGKYMFFIQSLTGNTLKAAPREGERRSETVAQRHSLLRRTVAAIGHADLRWHLWIVLAAVGRLDAALVAYAAYFPLRAVGGGLRKAVEHG